jgi:lysophospholipase L1-like esterase
MKSALPIWKISRLLTFAFVSVVFGTSVHALADDPHWVGTWGCGIQLTEPRNLPSSPGLAGNTLRQIVHSSIGGKQLRLHFSNAFGTGAVEMKSVHIALNPSVTTSSTIDLATDTALKFTGSESVIIPAGNDVWSDPVAFDLPALTNLAITIYYGQASSNSITGHPSSRCASYLLAGNAVASTSMDGAIQTEHWYNIEDVDVVAGDGGGAIVAFGDSITDGRGSTIGGNNRWPDILAQRLHTNPPTSNVSVINTGIGGNGIFGGLGPAGTKRFDRDVLDKSGAKWVIVLEGVNDIGTAQKPRASTLATNMIAAYQRFAEKAHASNIRVCGATITPFGGNGYYSVEHEAIRAEVNAWIRTNSVFDGLIDFDAAVRDPENPTKFKSEYHPGVYANDWLHLNPAGYRAMADSIDLNVFTK